MSADFTHARHTLIVSDIHLADAEPVHPYNPLWKRFKRKRYFIDASFRDFLSYMKEMIHAQGGPGSEDADGEGGIELIFNGDIFDFDSVMKIPTPEELASWGERRRITWLERKRGLASEERKSRYKLKVILDDHPVFVEAVRDFILRGNRVVFVIGNHDMELHWPSVRGDLIKHLDLPEVFESHVRFCEWFYVSNRDTLIEHGNQYDPYCLSANPINPLIKKGRRAYVRIPFGNLAGKYMLNGMGLFNPHADSSYIKGSLWDYLAFYFRYVLRVQPLLIWTWFWSALVTLVYSVSEGLLPAMTDPMTVAARVQEIALRANSTPGVVWALKDMHAHPAIYNPFKILRELWLDRAILLGLVFFLSFNFFSALHVFIGRASVWWFFGALMLLLPAFLFYARSVESEVSKTLEQAFEAAPQSARIAGVSRVVQGHVHLARHTSREGVEYLNTGTWSPAYRDAECTEAYGRKCFAWIRPASPSESGGRDGVRVAELYEWTEEGRALRIPTEGA
jgi:UDP-2,3-diacylglucosamine pyrophosphatase LpxH